MAKAKTDNEMVTRSIYIDKELYDRLQYAAGQFGVSVVLSQLGEKWLNKEIQIPLEPRENKDGQNAD